MQQLPDSIQRTYQKLRKEYSFYVIVKRINGKYYLYKELSKWSKSEKKAKVLSEYLGRITDKGEFIKKKDRSKHDLEKAKKLIAANGGKIIWAADETAAQPKQNIETNDMELKLLTILSMNARAPLSLISKLTGINPSTLSYQIKKIEEKYGIRYLLEINIGKIGYTAFLGFIKFDGEIPALDTLRKVMEEEPRIQFAATMKGEYDVVFYLLEENSERAVDVTWNLIRSSLLGRYNARWYVSPISRNYGFIPLREEFFNNLLKERVWHRSIENPKPKEEELMNREFIALKELNNNSTEDFKKIDEKHGLNHGAINYTYSKLKEKEIIVRPTITMGKLPIRYVSLLQLELINGNNFADTRAELLKEIITYGDIANKYVLDGDVVYPYSFTLIFPIVNEKEPDLTIEYLRNNLKGIKVKNYIISTVLTGSLCCRRFDNDYSRQYNSLLQLNATKSVTKTKYEK